MINMNRTVTVTAGAGPADCEIQELGGVKERGRETGELGE